MTIASDFINRLPKTKFQRKQKDTRDFFHLYAMQGKVNKTTLQYIVRDHDRALFEKESSIFQKIADEMNATLGAGTVQVTIKRSILQYERKSSSCNAYRSDCRRGDERPRHYPTNQTHPRRNRRLSIVLYGTSLSNILLADITFMGAMSMFSSIHDQSHQSHYWNRSKSGNTMHPKREITYTTRQSHNASFKRVCFKIPHVS